jgi:hypothetical protein
MVYLAGSFFFYILANHIGKKQLDEYWKLTYLTDIIKNIFITIAIFVYAFSPKESIKKESSSSVPYLDMI